MPGPCPEERPLPSRWEASDLGATLVGAVGRGENSQQTGAGSPPLRPLHPKLLEVSAAEWLTGVGSGVG